MYIKIKTFISTYKWLLIPFVPFLFFASFLFFLFSPATHPPTHTLPTAVPLNQQNTGVSQIPQQTEISPTLEQNVNSPLITQTRDIASGNLTFPAAPESSFPIGDYIDEPSLDQQTLPDGSIKYDYQSTDPNRPDIQIVKDGVIIFRRTLVYNVGKTIADYSTFLNNPPYSSQGSNYYGQNTLILANPKDGIAVVENPQTGQVYEQYIFHSLSVKEYVQKYGQDISSYQP